ncbi:MAG TPA: dihydrodipicolinate synthase family protein [Beutenbergiaceae bacterium]|nr:dihydrodipicolinate synthase family protein [Beutenbergiaceae bacterium]
MFTLINDRGETSTAELRPAPNYTPPARGLTSRVAYAAAHVVPHPWGDNTPGQPAEIDWDATLAFRRHAYSYGLGVADAMDTAQRNMGLDAAATRELISRSAQVAREENGSLVVGVNTDHVEEESISLSQVGDAYLEQLEFTEEQGAGPVIMSSRHLARAATSAADYREVYNRVLAAVQTPVVLHWLGTAFDPQLQGYFGSEDWRVAADTLIEIISANPGKVAGVKMSLLDAESELAVRARLPEGVRMLTGDDYNYVDLIGGEALVGVDGVNHAGKDGETLPVFQGHSDALLGAFAALVAPASAALQALDAGEPGEYERILRPTEELSRQIFARPTFYYKTGVFFMAWLNGFQPGFSMVGGLHSARSLPHLSTIVELANNAGALINLDLAAERWHTLLRTSGIEVVR